jgi:hypothetical protein
MKTKRCQWCDAGFETDISYQIYCSVACRELATKEKIAARYHISRRKKRLGKSRFCLSCQTSLSIYNDDTLCHNCLINPKDISRALKKLKGLGNGKNIKD